MSPTTSFSVLRSSGLSSFTTCKFNNETAFCRLDGVGGTRGGVGRINGGDGICAKKLQGFSHTVRHSFFLNISFPKIVMETTYNLVSV